MGARDDLFGVMASDDDEKKGYMDQRVGRYLEEGLKRHDGGEGRTCEEEEWSLLVL